MNFVEIAGNLGADPEERFTPSGKRVIGLRVATKVRQGGKDETIWWKVTIWGDRFDKMLPYLKKGSPIIVIGEMMKPETYVDKEGKTQVSLTITAEIIRFNPFGSGKAKEGEEGRQFAPRNQETKENHEMKQERVEVGVGASDDSGFTGDDLPF